MDALPRMQYALELIDVRKRFGDLVALDGVTVRLRPGSVQGFLGENGAGKSTLMNVAYGMIRPDTGRLHVGANDVVFRSPADAIAAGVGMVHQHFMLARAMSVLDNILLGDRRGGAFLYRHPTPGALLEMGEGPGLGGGPWGRGGARGGGGGPRGGGFG